MKIHISALLIVLMAIQPTLNFEFPSIEEFFGNLMKSTDSKTTEEAESSSRVKRQNPNIGDDSPHAYEVRTQRLPMLPDESGINYRYMPVIGNGHISTTVYSQQLYLNGLYNGVGAESHRAVIPATIMTRLILDNENEEGQTQRYFSFNVETGVFTETIDCPFALVEHKTYIHQKYIRVLVTDINVIPKGEYGGQFNLIYKEIEESPDITFSQQSDDLGLKRWNGVTKSAETGSAPQTVSVMQMPKPLSISVYPGSIPPNLTTLMASDKLQSAAQGDIIAARNVLFSRGSYALLQEHMDAWRNTWLRGKIEVTGNLLQSKITRFSQYYIMSTMPSMFAEQPPQYNEVFYGPTRTSLGKGGQKMNYRGHMFWDTEMYIFPTVLLFHPDIAKRLLRYRAATRQQAAAHAQKYSQQGLRYPWETAFSGNDVTPADCMDCRDQQVFTSSAVSWAIRNYWSATRDEDYLKNPDYISCDLTRDIAAFYASLAVYNSSKGRYDIKGIMGPDDWHGNSSNNAFTNVMASLAIHWARYFSCICNRNEREEVPDEWVMKALYLDLPYDNVRRIHYEYDGYATNTNKTIKQADTTMLTYPIAWNMSIDIMRNDLLYYEQYLTDRTPAMTYSFMTVGWKWVDEMTKMLNAFEKSYRDYLIQPFKIWTEYNERNWEDQLTGNVNFLPGMGGYLQSIVYGFAGVRIRPEAMEFHHPMPPPECNSIILTGFEYLGTEMDITITIDRVTIDVKSVGDGYMLDLKRNQTNAVEERLTPGAYIEIQNSQSGFFLYPSTQSSCEHPRDYIYMPWGYSSWLSGANTCSISSITFICSLLLVIYTNLQVHVR